MVIPPVKILVENWGILKILCSLRFKKKKHMIRKGLQSTTTFNCGGLFSVSGVVEKI